MDNEIIEEQKNRSLLRQRFLNVLKWMENKQDTKIDIEMFEGARVRGVFRSTDYNFSNLHFNNLETPIGVVPEALIRSSDIISLKININN
jgi:gem associated protein 7